MYDLNAKKLQELEREERGQVDRQTQERETDRERAKHTVRQTD